MNFRSLVEKALGELSLIIDGVYDENTFQKWFENNEIVFKCMGYTKVFPHPKIESDNVQDGLYVPDFMGLNNLGLWEIIEIKPAKAKIIKDSKRRHTLRASTEEYLSQCAEYSRLFGDRGYRDKFNKRYGVNCHKTPNVNLIMGRSTELDKAQLAEILSVRSNPHISIMTFDDVRDCVYQAINNSHGISSEKSNGLCVLFSATILNGKGEYFILDMCKKGGKSRIKIYVKNNKIYLEVIDRTGANFIGESTEMDFLNVLDKHTSFAVQISVHSDFSSVELLINDTSIIECRQRSFDFDFTDQLDHVIGSDQTGVFHSNMFFGGLIVMQVIPLIEERWILREFISSMTNELGETFLWEFKGHKFLHTPSHPFLGGSIPFSNALMQNDENKKPILRAKNIDN